MKSSRLVRSSASEVSVSVLFVPGRGASARVTLSSSSSAAACFTVTSFVTSVEAFSTSSVSSSFSMRCRFETRSVTMSTSGGTASSSPPWLTKAVTGVRNDSASAWCSRKTRVTTSLGAGKASPSMMTGTGNWRARGFSMMRVKRPCVTAVKPLTSRAARNAA